MKKCAYYCVGVKFFAHNARHNRNVSITLTYELLSDSKTVWWCCAESCSVFAGIQQIQNWGEEAVLLPSTMKPPPVRTEQTAVSELTSEPLSSCMPVGLPACLTDCLFVSRPVSLFKAALFARRSVFNIVRERAKKKGGGADLADLGRRFPLMHFHTLRNVVSHVQRIL